MHIPPLRERPTDIPMLIEHFVERSAKAMGKSISGVTEGAMQVLTAYRWPGNVRELENVVERAVILTKRAKIDVEDLPEELRFHSDATSMAVEDQEEEAATAQAATDGGAVALRDALKMPERDLILKVLTEVRWNRSEAAKRLGIHRSTLYHKIRKLGIHTTS